MLLVVLLAFCLQVSNASLMRPIQIIRPSSNHQNLELVEESLDQLARIEDKVAVVGVVGGYHSGKSFLLNSLISQWSENLSGQHSDLNLFEVADKVSPQTMGVWLVETNLTLADGSRVLFLDTEGFYGSNVSESYDAKIFSASTLLSSYLIYNSVKLIDQASVDYLEILSRRTQLFQIKNIIRHSENDELGGNVRDLAHRKMLQYNDFPPLSWVVKDFAQDLDGMTPGQWLDQYLDGRRDMTKETGEASLRDLFTRGISCHTMFLPATDLSELRNLGRVELSNLTSLFVQDLNSLLDEVSSNLKVKQLDGEPMNGESLSLLMRFILQYINQDSFPSPPSIRDNWMRELKGQASQEIQHFYHERMNRMIQVEPPLNSTDLEERHGYLLTQSMKFYREWLWNIRRLYQDSEKTLQDLLQTQYETTFQSLNAKYVKNYIENQVERYLSEMKQRVLDFTPPMNPETIEEEKNRAYLHWTSRYHDSFGKYEDLPVFSEQKARFLDLVEREYHDLDERNSNMVQTILNKATTECSNHYLIETKSVNNKARTSQELQQAERTGSAACLSGVETYLSEKIDQQAFQWVQKMPIYQKFRDELDHKKAELFAQIQHRNQKLVTELVQDKTQKAIKGAQDGHSNIHPFPDIEESISEKANTINNRWTQWFVDELSGFSDFGVYASEFEKLKHEFAALTQATFNRNINEVKAQSHYALEKAHAQLKRDQCSLCPENMFTFSYKWKAKRVAEHYLQEDEHARHFPEGLRTKAIEKWIETDLAKEINEVLLNMFMGLGAIFGACLFGIMISSCTRR